MPRAVIQQCRVALPGYDLDAEGLHALLCEGRRVTGPRASALSMARAVAGGPDADVLFIATTKGELQAWLDGGAATGFAALVEGLRAEPGLPPVWRVVSTACTSGAQAVIDAVELLHDGACLRAEVLGVDAVTPFIKEGFGCLEALGSAGARPFDAGRDGLALGSAAARVTLGAGGDGPAVVAWGGSNDANHISGPSRDGSGLALAIRRALDGVDASSIRAICAHGTGTVYNDAMETHALRAVFGDAMPPVFGVKGALGHTLGAAGVLELIVSAQVARTGVAPPTTGFKDAGPDTPPSLIHGAPREVGRGLVLTTNSGFGGMNTALVVDGGAP